ncbi:MAG: ferrous iron transport protein A [Nitrospirae bacterium]|nr:MAG: ferrous iron transport protein A [Nitrospirota bacterium]
MAPLGLLSPGDRGEIIEIITNLRCGTSRGGIHRVEQMGLRMGKSIEILKNEGCGPIIVKVDNTRIAIGRGIAMKILVRCCK